jgi:hypothetical protein
LRPSVGSGFGLDTPPSNDIRTQDLPPSVTHSIARTLLSSFSIPDLLYTVQKNYRYHYNHYVVFCYWCCSGLGIYLEYPIFWQSISSSVKPSAVTVSSNVTLDKVEVLISSEGNELWSQKMSVILDTMGLYEIVIMGIDSSLLVSSEELITFHLVQQQGLLVIIQVVSNKIFGEIAKLKTPYNMWI